jgi:hypothetical protein
MLPCWNRVGRATRLTGMRVRTSLLTSMVLVSACTGGSKDRPSSEASDSASPTAGGSPTAPAQPGWLAVDLRFYPDVVLTEGSISFIRVADALGEPVRSDRSRNVWPPRFRMQLAPGAYEVRTYRRPCDGSCRALDPPRDACEFGVEMAGDGSNRLVVVHVARGGECRVSDRGDVLDIDLDHPVVDLGALTRALPRRATKCTCDREIAGSDGSSWFRIGS